MSAPPDERQQHDDENTAVPAADRRLVAARKKLGSTLDALDTAGEAFGDAVEHGSQDGATDPLPDRVTAVLRRIGRVLARVAMTLAALAMVILGVRLLVTRTIGATAVGPTATVDLYGQARGALADVVLCAIGVGLGVRSRGLAEIARGLDLGGHLGSRLSPGAGSLPTGHGGLPAVGAGSDAQPVQAHGFGTCAPARYLRGGANGARNAGFLGRPGHAANGCARTTGTRD